MLSDVRVASPCSVDWGQMVGDDRIRFCGQCNLNVYNFSAMASAEIEYLLANRDGRLCARFYRRADGTMLTEDCPAGLKVKTRRVSTLAGAALSAAMGLSFAAAQKIPLADQRSLVQIDNAKYAVGIHVADPSSAAIGRAHVTLRDKTGEESAAGLTDEQGQVRLSGLYRGRYELEVYAPGFHPWKATLELPPGPGIELDVTLEMALSSNMGVIVDPESVAVDLIPSSRPIEDILPLAATLRASPAPVRARNRLQRFLSGLGHKLNF